VADDLTIELFDEPAPFLAIAGPYLAAEPVTSTVVVTNSHYLADRRAAGDPLPEGFPVWWAAALDASGAVVGVAMRTAVYQPHAPYVLSMPDEAARQLARALVARGERVPGVNGALPAARVLLDEVAAASGGEVVEHVRLRLFEATSVSLPPAPPGRLRVADEGDLGLLVAWMSAFGREADEQGGRVPDAGSGDHVTREDVARRIALGRFVVWEDADGVPVHFTGTAGPFHGVVRLGPVYTPPERRGRGYAGRLVAELTRSLLDDGHRVCLFTDQANPVSNRVYERIGFRPVVDTAELRLVGPADD
jgi:GNAT superfamily N-acetyltransferase